jgi:hypothetical protein
MDLTLDHVADGRFVLDAVGELHQLPGYAAEISAGGRRWHCERALYGFGQVVKAVDVDSGEPMGRYVPRGFLRARGVHAGRFVVGGHVWSWRADDERDGRFVLSYGEYDVGEFASGTPAQPVSMWLAGVAYSSPMLVLLCCYVVKLGFDTDHAPRITPPSPNG